MHFLKPWSKCVNIHKYLHTVYTYTQTNIHTYIQKLRQHPARRYEPTNMETLRIRGMNWTSWLHYSPESSETRITLASLLGSFLWLSYVSSKIVGYLRSRERQQYPSNTLHTWDAKTRCDILCYGKSKTWCGILGSWNWHRYLGHIPQLKLRILMEPL